MKRALIASVLGLAALGCSPKRVDIVERPPSGFTATAHAEPGEKCDAGLRQRAIDEANYHCEARGRRAVAEGKAERMTPEGCVLTLTFTCMSR